MKIVIQFYPDAQDEMDVMSLSPEVQFMTNDIPEAEAALGLLERKYIGKSNVVATEIKDF